MIRRRWMALPRLIRFMLTHLAHGVALGWGFVLALIWLDVLGIGALLAKDASGLTTALLFLQAALTFGAVAMAVAVMSLGEERD